MSESKNLTPREAHRLFNDENLTNGQIAERFDVSESTVIRRRKTFRETKETAAETVENKIEEYGIDTATDDDEPEENPFQEVECPACKGSMKKPDNPGEKECPNCNATLKFSEDEI